MRTEQKLIKKLEYQISKIEKFILDLQEDRHWQYLFYTKRLYLKLKTVFGSSHTEYNKYFEDIVTDFHIIKSTNNKDIKEYYLISIENKIFAFVKVLRSLKKLKKFGNDTLEDKFVYRQQQAAKLIQQQQSLEKMLVLLDKQYQVLNSKLVYGKSQDELKQKILSLLAKKGKFERELFSIKERVSLNS